MPLVSVIVPNYNHSEYLEQRIESILKQTFQDFEIILLDDCSPDHSCAILEKYRHHPKVTHLIVNEKNSGSTFVQWEKGVALAKGKYVWLAESDDWCESNLLENLLLGFEQDTECVISYCQSYLVEEGNPVVTSTKHNLLSEVIDGITFLKTRLLLYNPIINASMVLWKRDQFQHISEEFKSYKLCGDWLFWLELSTRGKVHVSGKVLNYFRKHQKNVSGKSFRSGLNFTETLKIINSLFQRKFISPEDYNKAFKIQFRNYVSVRNTLEPGLKEEIKTLFTHPLTTKAIWYKMLLSVFWRQLKGQM